MESIAGIWLCFKFSLVHIGNILMNWVRSICSECLVRISLYHILSIFSRMIILPFAQYFWQFCTLCFELLSHHVRTTSSKFCMIQQLELNWCPSKFSMIWWNYWGPVSSTCNKRSWVEELDLSKNSKIFRRTMDSTPCEINIATPTRIQARCSADRLIWSYCTRKQFCTENWIV